MTPEPARRPTRILAELMATTPTRARVMLDDLVDLVLGGEPAARARVSFLPARLALGALPCQQLLRLRARLRPPLLTRLWRIL